MDAAGIKSLNLVDLLANYYSMRFSRSSTEYRALSPFQSEKKPSFFVRSVNGCWLFKDFSSGHGGSFIDFVKIHENLSTVSEAMRFISDLLGESPRVVPAMPAPTHSDKPAYDLKKIHRTIMANGSSASQQYLQERGLDRELVSKLEEEKLIGDNHIYNRHYCCFVVRDGQGDLRCLDNHQIGGSDKFVLGRKHIFTMEHAELASSPGAFITEGIIDYLSVKALGDLSLPGLALLGNNLEVPGFEVLDHCQQVIAAFDDDHGGMSALVDLYTHFPGQQIEGYELEKCNDPNELLQVTRKGQRTNLTAERKVQIYHEFQTSKNRSELARHWGINRSYLYDIVRECEEILFETFSRRVRGRPSSSRPRTMPEAIDRIAELEKAHFQSERERERLRARSAFLKLRLKWASGGGEEDPAEDEPDSAAGEGESAVLSSSCPVPKKQVKKKRRRRQ